MKLLSSLFLSLAPRCGISALLLSSALSTLAAQQPWVDPAPPKVTPVTSATPPAPQPFDRLTFHHQPTPLAPGTQPPPLLHDWSATGSQLLWEVKKGDSYTNPAISGDRLILFHALDKRETIECLHPVTGQRYWTHDYPIDYRDRYGFANGPRGSPVIARDHVITLGVTAILTCTHLPTGQQIWQRDLRKDFHVPQDFFGHGGTPLIIGDQIIINVGGKAAEVPEGDSDERYQALARPGLSVGAFDLTTGRLLWGVRDEWGASYASPIAATIHGRPVVLLYAGGESNPATGGLMCIDPANGTLLDRFPWRADEYIQAIGSTPVVIPGQNRVFISTAYPKRHPLGGVMVEYDKNFKARALWESKKFATHWMTPVYQDGYLYGIDGETENKAQLVCYHAEKGTEQWRHDVTWQDTELNAGRPATLGIQRASLVQLESGGEGKTLCLGELGTLLWLDLSPEGVKVESRAQLFYAPHAWCPPIVHNGLLYIMQNYEEQVRGKTGQRLLAYNLRPPAKK